MEKVVLFCKSYDKDMLRARRLAESVLRFNSDALPLYLCVPRKELPAFRECFAGIPCHFLVDEEILDETVRCYGDLPKRFPAHLIQQLIKLEFWRTELCENYIWLDSDCYFIRPFTRSDFFADEQTPYTVMHDNSELLDFARRTGRQKIIDDFSRMTSKLQEAFCRSGDTVDFGYPPLIWSTKVLQNLAGYLRQRQDTIYNLLAAYPCEMQLYGEYLLYSKSIPIVPTGLLFKVYHYAEQFYEDQEKGENEYSLAQKHLGVVVQSNWARLPKPKKKLHDRFRKNCVAFSQQLKIFFLQRENFFR